MLSTVEVEKLANNLGKLKLNAVQYFCVVAAVVDATMRDTMPSRDDVSDGATSRRQDVSSANGAAPPAAKKQDFAFKSKKPRKTRGRRGIRNGQGLARARKILAQQPELTNTALAKATDVSWSVAKRARTSISNGQTETV